MFRRNVGVHFQCRQISVRNDNVYTVFSVISDKERDKEKGTGNLFPTLTNRDSFLGGRERKRLIDFSSSSCSCSSCCSSSSWSSRARSGLLTGCPSRRVLILMFCLQTRHALNSTPEAIFVHTWRTWKDKKNPASCREVERLAEAFTEVEWNWEREKTKQDRQRIERARASVNGFLRLRSLFFFFFWQNPVRKIKCNF